MAESFSGEKIKASTAERRWMENPVLPSSCVTPAGTSIEVQNEWEENTQHMHVWSSLVESVERSGKVANPTRGRLNRDKDFFRLRSRPRIWPRETASAVSSHVSLFILQPQAESGALTHTGFLPRFL